VASSSDTLSEWGLTSSGKTHYLRHRKGEKLTQRQAILAKCFACTNGFGDGRKDCGVTACPLHPYMPYREKKNA